MTPPPATVAASIQVPSLGTLKFDNAAAVSVNEVASPMSDVAPTAPDKLAKPESPTGTTPETVEKAENKMPAEEAKKPKADISSKATESSAESSKHTEDATKKPESTKKPEPP